MRPMTSTAAVLFAVAATHAGAQTRDAMGRSSTTARKIASARAAAPAGISRNATVMEMGKDGKMVTLHEGSNGWVCIPDDPATPGPDPMCMDKTWQDWLTAYTAKQAPSPSQVGIAYMLAGGADPSNADPFATKPAAGQHWVITGAHLMLILPDARSFEDYPTDPASGGAFVMWKGTPYAHVMVPVARGH